MILIALEMSSLPLTVLNWMLQEEQTYDAAEKNKHENKVEVSLEVTRKQKLENKEKGME